MPASDPRALALDVLLDVERGGAYADAVLSDRLDHSTLEGPDRGLATQLVYGSLARRLTLDHSIDVFTEQRSKRLEDTVRELLRLGIFQLAFLERVPSYAAVNSMVTLAKSRVPRAAGFVNAILRRCSRDGLASPPTDRIERLAVEHSHPQWIVRMWIETLGEADTIALMVANNDALPTVLRALVDREEALERLAAAGIGATAANMAPDAIVAAKPVRVAGIALPQSEASQLVVRYLAPQSGWRVLDACAAPGGKTAYIAALVGATGSVTALDPGHGASDRMRAVLHFAGVAERVDFRSLTVEDYRDDVGYDAVLVDAPCSGLGTLSEHPEIRWRRDPEDLLDLAGRQRSILAAAAQHVRPGGRLVYSTCTLTAAENDEIADWFLDHHPNFCADAGTVDSSMASCVDAGGRMRTFPHRHRMQGFFAAGFRRS